MRNAASPLKSPSIVFLGQEAIACRCGMPGLDEACVVCEVGVCQECAVFVDPATRLPTRPSVLLGRGVSRDFLAHRLCLSTKDTRSFPCIYAKDVPLMVQILKGDGEIGRLLPVSS